MSASESYIHLTSKASGACSLQRSTFAEATNTWLCIGCHRPKLGVQGVDVHIKERLAQIEGPLNLVGGCSVPMARLSFLFSLGEERVRRDLYLGRVFGPDGSRLEEWVTFRGKRGLIVRGSKSPHSGDTKKATFSVCPQCGRNRYFALGPHYLYPQPPNDVELFQSSSFGLIFPEYVANEVGMDKFRGVYVQRLRVLDKPKDDLPPIAF